jgi:hypothetical protein
MRTNSNATDPWMQTIGLLSQLSGVALSGGGRRAALRAKPAGEACWPLAPGTHHQALVTLIDRPTASTATIAWRDSTHCCYGDQIWRACCSRVSGVCAMSGRAINPNDLVFRSSRCRTSPLNAHAMILTCMLDGATSI